MMISYRKENQRFNYRIAGVCVHQDRVLLHQMEGDDYWALPGGRAELQETSEETIVREMMEETGYQTEPIRPLWFYEGFFLHKEEPLHELSVIYLIQFVNPDPVVFEDEFYGTEGNDKLIFRWFDIAELDETRLYPIFLKKGLQHMPATLTHYIENFKD